MRAALFDLDGTLMDTPRIIVESLRMTVGPSDNLPSEGKLRLQIGRPLDAIIADLFPAVSEERAAEKKRVFREAFRTATVPDARHLVFTEALALLDHLRQDGIQTAVVTSKITSSALELLEAGGILDSFDLVIGHDQAARGKPAPDLALLAASTLGVAPEECLVIGDSPDDMRMGRAAGTDTIGVTWGVASADVLADAGAARVVGTYGDLRNTMSASATHGASPPPKREYANRL